MEWREAGRNTWVESEACARIFEPCCSYMSAGVAFSPALVKVAKLSAPGLRFGSRGSQACVILAYMCFDFGGGGRVATS